jgi:hypothetical protein
MTVVLIQKTKILQNCNIGLHFSSAESKEDDLVFFKDLMSKGE